MQSSLLSSSLVSLSAESIWSLDLQGFVEFLDSRVFMQENRVVHFYTPNFACDKNSCAGSSGEAFPSISITGAKCALSCRHCKGRLLSTMYPATTPGDLFELCCKLQQNHKAVGCLISGGCLSNGVVPIKHFVETMAKVRRELNFTVFVHTGLIDYETAVLLKQTDAVDAVLIDIIGSQEVIDDVCRLTATVQDYANSLKVLQSAKLPFVPHVIVGLNNGVLDGEYDALKMISKTNPSAIVILALTPLSETDMEKTRSPQPYDVARVIAVARVMMPKTPVILGCMRPKDRQHVAVTDVLALKAGVDAIAFPSRVAINFAKSHGWVTVFSSYCCAKIFVDIGKKQ